MHVIKADHHRTLELAGVPDPVARPVDIDRPQTGFALLRSLRIYCFTAGSIIDGHAEDDEVLIVILAGSVQLTMSERELEESSPRFDLSAAGNANGECCVAYLPPNGAYRLIAQSNAEVAYARARTATARAPGVFAANMRTNPSGDAVLFEESTYPVHLRLRVATLGAAHGNDAVMPIEEAESGCESLLHVRTEPANGAATIKVMAMQPIALESWDTLVVLPGERPTLLLGEASSALLLVVLAAS